MSDLDPTRWPQVPQTSPRRQLFVADALDESTIALFNEKRYDIVDVRLLSSSSLELRADAVLATLEGARLGTIVLQPGQLKFLELEMRACGLHTGKRHIEDPDTLDGETMETLLDFGKKV